VKKNSKTEFEFEQIRHEFKKRGECPSPEQLVRYQQRALSTEEMLVIKQHLDLCGLCDWTLTQLTQFDSIANTEVQKRAERVRTKSFLRFILPALACAIVIALVYPVYFGIFRARPTVEKSNPGVGSARDFDLGEGTTTRSAPPSTRKTVVTLSPSENFFILSLFVPIRKNHVYEMEIKNEKGQKVDSGEINSRDALGNFSIVCSSNLFPDGNYELTIREIEKQTQHVKDEYSFQFRVERHQR
jgi:hypothetical protein